VSDYLFYDKLTFIYLEMPKFQKSLEEIETRFEKWLYVIRNLNRLESLPEKLQEKIFKKLFKVAEIAKFTPIQQQDYEESLKVYRDLKNSLDTARDEGIEIGVEKGIQIGVEKGKTQVATNLVDLGLENKTIAQATGLSLEEVEQLRKK
jgi:predicted transposase/invertase (TIGR01784 family)